MKILFVTSSIGDTAAALAIAGNLQEQAQEVEFLALTQVALDRLLTKFPKIILLTDITLINKHIKEHHYTKVVIGVSSDEGFTLPYLLAQALDLPVFMLYEYMFASKGHVFLEKLPELAKKPKIQYLATLANAKNLLISLGVPEDKVHIIGHLSIDKAFSSPPPSNERIAAIKAKLQVDVAQELIFYSGSTIKLVDEESSINKALRTIESERKENFVVRMTVHPGVKDLEEYLHTILPLISGSPASLRFKIAITQALLTKVQEILKAHFIDYQSIFIKVDDEANVSDAVYEASDRVIQAVPGAYYNSAMLRNGQEYCLNPKTSFFHDCDTASKQTLGLPDASSGELGAVILSCTP
jgi:hypothetical protein